MNAEERPRRLLRWIGIGADSRRLPGSLADEAPRPVESVAPGHPLAGKWEPRPLPEGEAVPVMPEFTEQEREFLLRRLGQSVMRQPAPTPPPAQRTLEDRYLEVCEQLREMRDDRDALEKVADRRAKRIAELELTVQHLARQLAEQERETPTVEMPRIRSHPAPGASGG